MMTYLDFLFRFLVVPILILGVLVYRDRQRMPIRSEATLPAPLRFVPPALAIAILAAIAVIYTTPWDNYLVATRVWWYDPALVMGITLGWVPLEEYLFFVLQTVLTGLWLMFLIRRLPASASFVARSGIRVVSSAGVTLLWIASIILLFSGWRPGNYLALELAWALPGIAFQLAFGADILWHHRRLVLLAIATTTLYYSGADVLAIHSGTWTINPELTLGISLGGILPLEEAIFFLLTNTLLVFGLVLALARESSYRLPLRFVSTPISQNR
jgi:lycopene cyclase domain-containing protein